MDHIVNTPCGAVRGVATDVEGIVAYKGIRYATAERFEYPREVTSWEGIYDATEYGNCAYQPRSFYDEREMPKKVFYYNEFRKGRDFTYSEDCLFLNIFAPEGEAKGLPVIVAIHGGGYTGGCGFEKHFDTPVWPKLGAIAVTINYRLGPLGFAVLPELKEEAGKTGNYALYDQLTALTWVKRNITAFGGDPENITVMGQSAGAMSVQHLCLSPLCEGLIAKAVMCSGGGVSSMIEPKAAEERYPLWGEVMEKCGAKSLEEFRRIPVEELFRAWQSIKVRSMGRGCEPVIDGEIIVGSESKLFREGRQLKIPYMIGTTSHDIIPPILFSISRDWAKKQSTPAYLGFFERGLPGDDKGAWHSSDLWYWFGTLRNGWRPFEDRDRALSDEMAIRLVAFAKNGSPNAQGLTEWLPGGRCAMSFGDGESRMKNPSMFKLWWTMFTNHAPGE